MKNIKKSIGYGSLLFVFGMVHRAYAVGEGEGVKLNNPINSPNIQCFIADVLKIVVNFGSVICVFFIIYSGFLFVTARGDESQVTKARNTFFWTVIGTAVLLGAWVLAQVISGTIGGILQQNINFSCTNNDAMSGGIFQPSQGTLFPDNGGIPTESPTT